MKTLGKAILIILILALVFAVIQIEEKESGKQTFFDKLWNNKKTLYIQPTIEVPITQPIAEQQPITSTSPPPETWNLQHGETSLQYQIGHNLFIGTKLT